ncbi:MAG TPA: ATP-binding protein [Candidatus Limnocylindrales bacterium]|nr:ATP-binding protein [Candidatus Limnocylindrales bacterium]
MADTERASRSGALDDRRRGSADRRERSGSPAGPGSNEAQLRQSQRLEAVGQLAGGIAHDFNNLLTAIRGYAELAGMSLEPDHPAAADIASAIAATDRAKTLVAQLLAFSRRQHLEPQVVDPTDAVQDVVPMLDRLLGEGIELTFRSEPAVGRITVDPGQLGQVIVNLAVNARDAMGGGGRLAIEIMNVELDEAYAATHADATPGPHVLIAVSDTGAGMDAATQARAFEPFFTTKPADRGTGMGLATVYGIVKQSGGSIYLYSEPGRGTTFKLYFPRTDAGAAVDRAARTSSGDAAGRESTDGTDGALAGTETILLVEDDDDVREYARRVLAEAGYRVLPADRPNRALEISATHPVEIDLLVADLILPGVHGSELAERLLVRRPATRVVFVSGFTEDAILAHGVERDGAAFLSKPYRAADLLRVVRTVLDEPAPRPSDAERASLV